MKYLFEISKWGRKNPKKAIGIITSMQFLLILLAVILGSILYLLDIPSIIWPLYILSIPIVVVLILFPQKKAPLEKLHHSFLKQKSLLVILCMTCFLVISLGTNNYIQESENYFHLNQSPSFTSDSPQVLPVVFKTMKKATTKNAKPRIVKLKNKFISILKKKKEKLRQDKNSRSKKAKLIILCILILLSSIAITFGMTGLACFAICEGLIILFAIFIVIGLAAIGLGIFGIFRLIKKYKRETSDSPIKTRRHKKVKNKEG